METHTRVGCTFGSYFAPFSSFRQSRTVSITIHFFQVILRRRWSPRPVRPVATVASLPVGTLATAPFLIPNIVPIFIPAVPAAAPAATAIVSVIVAAPARAARTVAITTSTTRRTTTAPHRGGKPLGPLQHWNLAAVVLKKADAYLDSQTGSIKVPPMPFSQKISGSHEGSRYVSTYMSSNAALASLELRNSIKA